MLAALLFMKRMSEAVNIKQQSLQDLRQETANPHFALAHDAVVFSMDGPFFYGVTERLINALEQVHGEAHTLVLRMKNVPIVDASGLQAFEDLIKSCTKNNTRLVLCELRPNILEKMRRAGLLEKLGAQNVVEDIRHLAPMA
jgi:SulP family sulfate permease